MNELIKITKDSAGKELVSARELHKFLELDKSQISRWLDSKIFKNGFFTENEDFVRLDIFVEGQQTIDYAITLEIAKRLCMMTKSKKGEEIRSYFIECEKIAKDFQEINMPKLPSNLKEAYLALAQAEEEKELLLLQNENLNTVLDNLLEWVSIIKVCQHNGVKENVFNWRKLKSKSTELGYQTKRAESPRFGYMNLYHVDAFRACYPQFDYNIND